MRTRRRRVLSVPRRPTKTVKGLNGWPRAASVDARAGAAVAGAGANRLPADSVHCITVPGGPCWATA